MVQPGSKAAGGRWEAGDGCRDRANKGQGGKGEDRAGPMSDASTSTPLPQSGASGRAPAGGADPAAGADGAQAGPGVSGSAPGGGGAPPATRGWRIRRWHFHLSIWSLVTSLAFALFLVLSSMAFTGRVIVLPDWVTERIQMELNAALPSGSVTLTRVEAGLTRGGRPRVRLVEVALRDGSGLTLAQLNAVEGSFSRRAALRGRLRPGVIALQGAQVTLRRLADGTFDLALGRNAAPNARPATTGDLAALLDKIDALFATGAMENVVSLSAADLTVTLEDARSGRVWQVTDGVLTIEPKAAFTDTKVRFDVFNGTDELASTEFAFRSDRKTSEASLSARFENAAARDIAAQTPVMAFLSVIDAPISGALRTTLDPGGALEELAGTLRIDAGALVPAPGTPPAQFDGAQIYLDFDPARQRIDFTGASLRTEVGTMRAEGHVYLADFNNGWPNALIGQVHIPDATLAPRDVFAEPLEIDSGTADIRVRLAPFEIDFGQLVAIREGNRYQAAGRLGADGAGWWLSLDGRFERGSRTEALALWPVSAGPESRTWVRDNITGGEVVDGTLAFRKPADGELTMNGTFGVENASVNAVQGMPPVLVERGYVVLAPEMTSIVAETAEITAPDGNRLDVSGTTFQVPSTGEAASFGEVGLRLAGPVRGVLSTLAGEPFGIFDGAESGIGPDMARGEASAEGRIVVPLDADGTAEQVRFDIAATLSDISSDVLIENKLLVGDRLTLRASNTGVEVSGPVRIGLARAEGHYTLPLVNGTSLPATVSGTLDITPATLSEFGMEDLSEMVSGQTRGRFEIALGEAGEVPVLTLTSSLGGLAMRIPGTGWSKAPEATGTLEVEARLGDRPEVTSLALFAPGLSATGRVSTAEGGGLGEAVFDKVDLGGWLKGAAVRIIGRGPELPVAIAVTGGTVDLRNTEFDDDTGAGSGRRGPRRPLSLALDRLIVSDKIRFSKLRADLDLAGGLSGTFSGNLPKGNRLTGTVAQTGQGAAFRVTGARAGQVLKAAGIFDRAKGGELELILAPVAGVGTYEGEFTISDLSVHNAPALAEMLSAVSVIGLLDQLQGEGIRFSDVTGRFRLGPGSVTLYRSAAVGASMGLSLDGYYDMTGGQIDMQGVLSPLYILNAIGRVFSPRDGEGLVGFNFTLKGDAAAPEVKVNPLSILTPGVLREIFRRAPPETPGAGASGQ